MTDTETVKETVQEDGGEYYVQRHASGLVGNLLVWWRKGGHGYTCDIDDAETWTEDAVIALLQEDEGEKYTVWPKILIDAKAFRASSIETLHPHDSFHNADAMLKQKENNDD